MPDINADTVYITDETFGQNLNEIASNLKRAYQSAEYKSVKLYTELGGLLSIAKARFDERKILEKIETTWQVWVEENTGMSPSYCRTVKSMFKLVSKYPKLKHLKGITFTELCKLSKNIKSTFEDPTISINWVELPPADG